VSFSRYSGLHFFRLLGISTIFCTIVHNKGETKSIAIAAASIIARYQYMELMEEISNKINYKLPIGANFENIIKPLILYLKNELHWDKQELETKISKIIKNNLQKALSFINTIY